MDDRTLQFVSGLTNALFGLLGVLTGGWIAHRSQAAQRQTAWHQRQLQEFYSPMLGLRQRIRAKSTSRERVWQAASAAARIVTNSPPSARDLELEEIRNDTNAMIEFDNRVLREELLPLYRQMVDHFSMHIGLAQPETRRHFDALVHFVDIWDRSQAKALPADVLKELGHRERTLETFYMDLEENVDRLQRELQR